MAAQHLSGEHFLLGDWLVRPSLARIERGGETVHVTPQAMAVLVYLAQARGRVVTRNELMDAVWPRMAVTPDALSQCIVELRKAFGDRAKQPTVIETIRKVGIRLIPPVASAAPTPDLAATQLAASPQLQHVGALPLDTGRRRVWRANEALALAVVLLTVALVAVSYYLRGAAAPADTVPSVPTASGQPSSYVIHAPPGSSFGMAPSEPSPALSADGSELAFVAPLGSKHVLWVQKLGDLEARPLLGSDGAFAPFWSPDGDFIAFAADGRLKRIAATGGLAPRDIAVTDGGYGGGTWSADGTIVFAGDSGLYRVPSDGGEAEPLTRIDAARGEFAHRFPLMLPGEARFLYLVLSTLDEHAGLYLGSLDDPKTKLRLLPSHANAAFGLGPDGRLHLFFVRDSALLAQPFNASLDALNGDPVVIANHEIDTAPSVRWAAFAGGGRALVYRPRFAPSTQLVWIDRDRAGIVGERIGGEAGRWRFPALSPDGTTLVALREDRSDAAGLWSFNLRSGMSRRLAPGSWVSETVGGALMSAWAPDSQRVVYSLARPGGWGLYWQPMTGLAEPLLSGPSPFHKRVRDVTGEIVLFQDDDEHALWVLPLPAKQQTLRLPIEGEMNHARVSPDGRWLAYTVTDADRTEVYVTSFPVPGERWLVSTAGGVDPQWRRDGAELYYVAPDQTLMAVSVGSGATFHAGPPEPLFRASFDRSSLAYGSAYSPMPNGQRFVVAEAIGDSEAYLIARVNWITTQR